ncbi:hypothetical protein FRC09_008059 [Ceratobasidium sp. 395]|nr:hypothetical protein FRC09_008059 [Ceratobasidium sp. 395]
MSASTVSKPVPVYGPAKTLKVLRAVERLGGSAGYLKYLSEQNKPKAVPELPVRDDSTVETVLVEFISAVLYSMAHVTTSSGHSTTLEAFGLGLLVADVSGSLTLNTTWDDMLDGPMDFVCTGGGENFCALTIIFSRNDTNLAQIITVGEVEGYGNFSGTCTWR